ncbi:short-chain type dehydrogenase/reductase-like protein [Tanacetum coccineum]
MAEPTTISLSLTTQQRQLHDRIAIVTGGFGGIGQAIALHLASLGAKLIIADLTTSTLPLTLSETQAFAFKTDISDPPIAALKPGYGTYTASKAAVEVIVKIMAKELKGTGITANCVAPGPIATEMFFTGKTEEMIQKVIDLNPSSRLGTTDDIAPVVGFLAGDAGDWINGQVIRVNGGYV